MRWSAIVIVAALVGCGGGDPAPPPAESAAPAAQSAPKARKKKKTRKRPVRRPVMRQRLTQPSMMNSEITELTMTLVYVDEGAGVWSCLDLVQGKGVIQQDDLEPADFRRARGGLRLYRDRIFCFLDSEAGGDLAGYARFLLGSLAALGGEKVDPALAALRSAKEMSGLKDIAAALMHRDRSSLILQEATDGNLKLSYLDPHGRVPTERLAPYFSKLLIERAAWITAACDALDEYFQLVARVKSQAVKPDPELNKLEALWSRVNREMRKLAL